MHASQDELSQFLLGSLPLERAEALDRHLGECQQCQDTVNGLNPAPDTIVARLREASPAAEHIDEPQCRRMVDEILRLGPPPAATARPQPFALERSQTLREYRILENLGAGGMGAVYKALHTKLGRTVAIKVLPPGRWQDPAAVSRFEREIKVVGQLEHPHIVRATDAGTVDGIHFLVMELVDGIDLDKLVRRQGVLPLPEACELIRQAATGLQHAYERGIVHRDIKPSNLMLARTPDGGAVVKILDLGLALLELPDAEALGELTSDGVLMGTIDYMAPEQAQDTHSVDIRADLYALGATLYKLLTGRPPLAHARDDSMMKKLLALAVEEPQPVRELRPDVPPELAQQIHRMLAKKASRRPETPRDVAETVAPFSLGANLRRLLDDPGRSEGANSRETFPRTAPRRRRGQKWSLASLVAIVAASVLLAAVFLFSFSTADGVVTVRVSTDHDVTSIQADGRTVKWEAKEGSGEYEVRIRPGEVTSLVLKTSDGTDIHADIPPAGLKIQAGRHYTVQAKVTPQGTEPALETGVASSLRIANFGVPDQEVIDWVFSKRGRVGGGNAATGYVVVEPGEALPEGGFDLVTIDLFERSFADEDLRRLDGLEHLTTLIINSTPVSNRGMAQLGALPRLARIYAGQTLITSQAIEHLKRYPTLSVLHLSETAVDDAGVAELRHLPRLKELFLAKCPITAASVDRLARFPSLEWLNVTGTSLTKQDVQSLVRRLPRCKIESDFGVFAPSPDGTPREKSVDQQVAEWVRGLGGSVGLATVSQGYKTVRPDDEMPDDDYFLVVLDLFRQPITDEDLQRLDGLQHFTTLILPDTPITDAGLRNLGDLPKLQLVYLGNTQITDAGMRELVERYPDLHVIHAGGTRMTDASIATFAQLRRLSVLSIPDLPLTDDALGTLTQMQGLQMLSVRNTGITPEGFERLRKALPHCTIWSSHGVHHVGPIEGEASLLFDGIDDNVEIPSLVYDGQGPITIEASVRLGPPLHEFSTVVSNLRGVDGPAGVDLSFHFESDWNFAIKTDRVDAARGTRDGGLVTKLAGVWDGEQIRLFIDGRLVAEQPYVAGPRGDAEPRFFVIGASRSLARPGNLFYFKGAIDEVRISDVARYDADYPPVARLEADEQTLALYHFDEGEGAVVKDASGNGHDGKIYSAQWIGREPE